MLKARGSEARKIRSAFKCCVKNVILHLGVFSSVVSPELTDCIMLAWGSKYVLIMRMIDITLQ